jgi:hypothetical protein
LGEAVAQLREQNHLPFQSRARSPLAGILIPLPLDLHLLDFVEKDDGRHALNAGALHGLAQAVRTV